MRMDELDPGATMIVRVIRVKMLKRLGAEMEADEAQERATE